MVLCIVARARRTSCAAHARLLASQEKEPGLLHVAIVFVIYSYMSLITVMHCSSVDSGRKRGLGCEIL